MNDKTTPNMMDLVESFVIHQQKQKLKGKTQTGKKKDKEKERAGDKDKEKEKNKMYKDMELKEYQPDHKQLQAVLQENVLKNKYKRNKNG